ncbi:MAG: glutamate-5-semialdehyde dehydrogenase [Elusimicrobia bacterium RIFOXYA2_FULL_50_26]|nr:MAG: glutamate-5-semialdehyde dehydrogenase [Elusimicrobia bacterium RIFOXYA2_FULL_50_26]
MNIEQIKEVVVRHAMAARGAALKLGQLPGDARNAVLIAMAEALVKEKDDILFYNEIDVQAAKDAKLPAALIDRLALDEKRIQDMARGLREVVSLPDPVGEIIADWTPPVGVHIDKIRVPLGVIAMIYESRPNVTVDAAGLCLKAGNAIILRGGSEAINSNRALVKIISRAAYGAGLPQGAIQFIETTDRAAVAELVKLDTLVDIVIPRGSSEMIRSIRENATVPVLAHGKGLCHTYIDKAADVRMAVKIAFNAKCQRPGVCNAMETLLVHKDIARTVLPELNKLYRQAGCEVRGDEEVRSIISDVKIASEADWSTEYLDKILSIKTVASLDEAILHINRHGSGHSEAIVTNDETAARRFLMEVDAAAVFHNASTRLHDGGVFGFGSEIGISTQKLHARGTMGVKELTTTKYVIYGHGEIRE